MRILFWGKGARAEVCLAHLLENGFSVCGVIAEKDEPAGRPESLAGQAAAAGIACHVVAKPRSLAARELVAGFGADIFVLAGYTRILPPEVVSLPPMGTVNLHGGRIPDYRGCAPIPWQIIRGETELGLTVLYADQGIDTGAILVEDTYSLTPDQGATEAVARTLELFPPMLARALRGLANNTITARPQDPAAGAYYTRRYPEDGVIDCRMLDAEQIFNLVRALRKPYPGAFAWRGREKIVIQRACLLKEKIFGVPGHVPLKRDEGVVLIARDQGLLITELRTDDRIVPARDLLRVGDRLEHRPS